MTTHIQLSIRELHIPFKQEFKHAAAARAATESVIVAAKLNSDITGHGESCPREYVTGETLRTALEFFNQFKHDIENNIVDLDTLRQWMTRQRDNINKNPAAWCAIELALLDVLAQQQSQSVEKLLALPPIKGEFTYSAVMGDTGHETFIKQFKQYRQRGFNNFKVKLSGNLERDQQKLNVFTQTKDEKIHVRLDANNLWHHVDEATVYLTKLEYPFTAVEEPLASKRVDELAILADRINKKIILDETLLCVEDINLLRNTQTHKWIINLRVSKMGGILRSLDVASAARLLGIPIIIGAQVGETSLLTRAALTIANANRDILIAQEGAFGHLLLQHDICETCLMFAQQGKLHADNYNFSHAPGWGIAVVN